MWRSLWRSFDRFSLQYFKQVINELSEIKVVDQHNKELVVDLLQSIVEIVTYGDKQDPMIFEYFMEKQVLAEFLRVLKISNNSRIEAPLLQYLSIMIQNLSSDQAVYYCFSNDYINNIILHNFEFNRGDLTQYYVSFLRAVSSKLNRETLCLLVKVQADAVVSFPLFDEALKFAAHEEKLIRTAIRNLSLSIFDASDDVIFRYITTPPASKYFSDLVFSLRDQCFDLDRLINDSVNECTHTKPKELFLQADKIVDELYYFKDIISIGESLLSKLVIENLLSLLVFPALNPLLKFEQNNVPNPSASTSLYFISLLLQVIEVKGIINPVAGLILYPYTTSTVRDAIIRFAAEGSNLRSSFSYHLNTLESNLSSVLNNIHSKRNGMTAFIDSENHSLLLQSLFLLLVIAESKDLDRLLALVIGLNGMKETDENFFSRFMDEILNALLKVLASQTALSVLIKWHTGWFIRKLLIAQVKSLNDHTLELFNISYEQSRDQFKKELDGCWFDHILDTFRNEWKSCKAVLEESCQRKDPMFALELAFAQQTTSDDKASHADWQRMVDAVKDFVLHLQLKSYMSSGSLVEHPILNPKLSPASDSGQTHASDISTASFGSEVSLVSGVPCKVAFSHAGIRDIYLIPVATSTSGRVLLVEKNPFRSQRGVVLAMAPLAGLSPKIDEAHPTWLHLRIREFDPKFANNNNNTNVQNPNMSNHVTDGKWTLGFQNLKDCDAARLLILEQTRNQRSGVEDLLSPLLHHDFSSSSAKWSNHVKLLRTDEEDS